jgi:CRISPR-associated endonuclease/helicase Cas3
MRVLVEQTRDVAQSIANRINKTLPESLKIHTAIGGEDAGDWFLYPERTAIIIGTQDMLLSRALNRGYASSRSRWPVEYGLLNHDALWVMDEVQLMDVGLATSAQLQSFRDEDSGRSERPCATWWMSATLQPDWLRSIDRRTLRSACNPTAGRSFRSVEVLDA